MKDYELIECPRDAMQGIREFIPTEKKLEYLNALLKVGFDVLDCGSFVSAKAIPQMQDTAEIIPRLSVKDVGTRLLCIVANVRGAEEACGYENISFLGFPFSVSEEFQRRNTNSTREESLRRVEEMVGLCARNRKSLVVYLSMAFGNPYGEEWNPEIVISWALRLKNIGVTEFRLADTVGCSDENNIALLFNLIKSEMPGSKVGVHLHAVPEQSKSKILAAWDSGCRIYDSALLGMGGCPMARNELVGNIPTETLLECIRNLNNGKKNWNEEALNECVLLAREIFSTYH